ncbi:MAG: plasmid pRiA4b ORF-3 family protein [Nitrococcus sp.]|nr:plasmid pRiA4b ORF-3 family protein [Nitrococcus sp.]
MRTRDPSAEPVIYTLSVQCVFGAYLDGECVRVIEIPDDATLEDLHFAIQEAVSFDNDHLYDFYAGRNYRNRKIEYTKAWDCEGREDPYAEICLRDVYPLESLKLYYIFDYGDSWTFEIRKSRKVHPAQSGIAYPRIVERRGPNPEQYPSWE